MLFFRSEENIHHWCRERGVEPGGVATMSQLWEMSVAWYSNRLNPGGGRPPLSDVAAIFAKIGLRDAFWDPLAGL